MLPEGAPVAGVTSLRDEIYILRGKDANQVEVYNAVTYCLLRFLTVPGARAFTDMTACEYFLCLYICDSIAECVHRLDLIDNATKWPVYDVPCTLSVNAHKHSVVVTCNKAGKIKEFSPGGDLLREVALPDEVVNPWHAIQLASGGFIACHGTYGDPIHRVCTMNADGRVSRSHVDGPGSEVCQYDVPYHLAVDDNEYVFVADRNNRRVTLLSPTLEYKGEVVSPDQMNWKPYRLCLDAQRRRLYVTANERRDGNYTLGRVVVFRV